MMDILKELQSKGISTVIDVGANVGDMTAIYQTWNPKRLIAIEPVQQHHSTIKGKAPQAEIIGAAVGSKNGSCEMRILGKGSGIDMGLMTGSLMLIEQKWIPPTNPEDVFVVPMITIDSLNIEDLSFMKIDVEGYESEVLLGAKETLHRCQPIIQMEVHTGIDPAFSQQMTDHSCQLSELIQHALTEVGYDVVEIYENQWFLQKMENDGGF